MVPAELNGAFQDKVVKVVGAKVSYANFYAIRRDFPQVRLLNDAQISQWVLDNFAYINEEQLKLNGIRNTEIPVDKTQTKADYRPPGYGRAGVLEATYDGKPIGLVDIKGLGLQKGRADSQVTKFKAANGNAAAEDALRTQDHSDGMMRHGEAVAETTRQTAVQRLFDIHNKKNGTDFETVETYFVIQLPFDVMGPNGGRDKAALYGRQAHWRGTSVSTPPNIYRDPFGGMQSSKLGSAVDFGGVLADIDPRLKDNFSVFPGQPENDPQKSKPWAWGHDTAKAFERGDPSVVYRHLDEMLAPIQGEWKDHQPSLEPREAGTKDLVEAYRAVHQPDMSDADFEKVIRVLQSSGGPGAKYGLVREAVARHLSPKRAAQAMLRIPALATDTSFTRHRREDLFLELAGSPDEAIRRAALGVIPRPETKISEPILKALVRLAGEFPANRTSIVTWALAAVPILVDQAKRSGKPYADDPNLILTRQILKALIADPAEPTQWAVAELMNKVELGAKAGESSGLSTDERKLVAEVYLKAARAKSNDRSRFEAVGKYRITRDTLPADTPGLPTLTELRAEVHDQAIQQLAAEALPQAALSRARELKEAGMIDPRLDTFFLTQYIKIVDDPKADFAERVKAFRQYHVLHGEAKIIGTFPTPDALAEKLIQSKLDDIAANGRAVDKAAAYQKLMAEGFNVERVQRVAGENLLALIQNPKEPIHERAWALEQYSQQTSLRDIKRTGGQAFPQFGDLREDLSRSILLLAKTMADPHERLAAYKEVLNYGQQSPELFDATLKALRESVPGHMREEPNRYSTSPEADRIRSKAAERAWVIGKLLGQTPDDPKVLEVALWLAEHDSQSVLGVIREKMGLEQYRPFPTLAVADPTKTRIRILIVQLRNLSAHATELSELLKHTDPAIRDTTAGRLTELYETMPPNRWPGLGAELLTYWKARLEKTPPGSPSRVNAFTHYSNIHKSEGAQAASFPDPEPMKKALLLEIAAQPANLDPYARLDLARAIALMHGSLNDEGKELLRSGLTAALESHSADTTAQQDKREIAFGLWLKSFGEEAIVTPADRKLMGLALGDPTPGVRSSALAKLAQKPMEGTDWRKPILAAAPTLSPENVVHAARALSYTPGAGPEVGEAFALWIARKDLSSVQRAAVLEAGKKAEMDSPKWVAALTEYLDHAPDGYEKNLAVESLLASSKRTNSVNVELIRRLAKIVATPSELSHYQTPVGAALTALVEYGVPHEDIVKALEASAKSSNGDRQNQTFEAARKLGVRSPVLLARAKEILRQTTARGQGAFKGPAEYLVTESPILGGFFVSNRVREIERSESLLLYQANVRTSEVKRLAFIASSGSPSASLCKDFFRALHPLSAVSLMDRSLSLGLPALFGTVAVAGGYTVYEIAHDRDPLDLGSKRDATGKPLERPSQRSHKPGTGEVVYARVRREGEFREACVAGGGSVRSGVCICEAANKQTMNAWTEDCVRYR